MLRSKIHRCNNRLVSTCVSLTLHLIQGISLKRMFCLLDPFIISLFLSACLLQADRGSWIRYHPRGTKIIRSFLGRVMGRKLDIFIPHERSSCGIHTGEGSPRLNGSFTTMCKIVGTSTGGTVLKLVLASMYTLTEIGPSSLII